jgi:ribosomal-protein-alanine N-acetyltransferase
MHHIVPLRPIHMIDLSALRLGAAAGSPFARTRSQLVRVLADGHAQGIPAFTVVSGDAIVGLLLFEQVYRDVTRSARMSVWIDQDKRSRGIGTAAVRRALASAADAGLRRIEAAVLPESAAGRRMLTRVGFTPIGLARELLLVDGQWRDHVLYEFVIGD